MIIAELAPARDVTYGRSPLAHFAADVWVLTRRSIVRIRREPDAASRACRRELGRGHAGGVRAVGGASVPPQGARLSDRPGDPGPRPRYA
jgi:hypothetical protein